MKTFKEYLSETFRADAILSRLETIQLEEETSSASTTTTGGVANPDAKPLFKKSSFAGHPCIECDDETWNNFVGGKKPFKRWMNYVENEDLRKELKDMYYKNSRVLVKNSKTGGMVYVK